MAVHVVVNMLSGAEVAQDNFQPDETVASVKRLVQKSCGCDTSQQLLLLGAREARNSCPLGRLLGEGDHLCFGLVIRQWSAKDCFRDLAEDPHHYQKLREIVIEKLANAALADVQERLDRLEARMGGCYGAAEAAQRDKLLSRRDPKVLLQSDAELVDGWIAMVLKDWDGIVAADVHKESVLSMVICDLERMAEASQQQYESEELRRSMGSWSLATLQDRDQWKQAGIPADSLEAFLSDSEFANVFGMTKEQFEVLKPWRRKELKRKHGLF